MGFIAAVAFFAEGEPTALAAVLVRAICLRMRAARIAARITAGSEKIGIQRRITGEIAAAHIATRGRPIRHPVDDLESLVWLLRLAAIRRGGGTFGGWRLRRVGCLLLASKRRATEKPTENDDPGTGSCHGRVLLDEWEPRKYIHPGSAKHAGSRMRFPCIRFGFSCRGHYFVV